MPSSSFVGVRSNPLEVVAKLIQVIRRYHPRASDSEVATSMSLKYHLQPMRTDPLCNRGSVKPGGRASPTSVAGSPVAATWNLYILPLNTACGTETIEYHSVGMTTRRMPCPSLQLARPTQSRGMRRTRERGCLLGDEQLRADQMLAGGDDTLELEYAGYSRAGRATATSPQSTFRNSQWR